MEYSQTLEKLGARLSELREGQNISISRLAYLCEMDEGSIHALEAGKTDCEIHLLLQISDILEVKLSELFDFPE
jgi:predicted transcriptional regulator